MEGGADLLLIETIFDTLNAKAAAFAIEKLFVELGRRLPVMISAPSPMPRGAPSRGRPPRPSGIRSRMCSRSPSASTARWAPGAAPVCGRTLAGVRLLRLRPPQCRPAQSALAHRLRRDARSAGRRDRRLGEGGMLNIVGGCCGTAPGPYRGDRRGGRGRGAARGARDREKLRLSGLEPFNVGRGFALRERRRAHQRHRLQGLRPDDPRRALRRRAVGRPPAGRERRPGDRHQHGRGDARLHGGDGEVPQADRLRARHLAVPIMLDSSKWSVIEAGLKCIQGKGW